MSENEQKRIRRLATNCFLVGDTLEDTARIEHSFGKPVADYFRDHYPDFPEAPQRRFRKSQEAIDKKNNQLVGPNLTYGDWKGTTGPGRLCREIINHERKRNVCA